MSSLDDSTTLSKQGVRDGDVGHQATDAHAPETGSPAAAPEAPVGDGARPEPAATDGAPEGAIVDAPPAATLAAATPDAPVASPPGPDPRPALESDPPAPAAAAPAAEPATLGDAELALERRDYATARRLFDTLGRTDMAEAIDRALAALDRKDYGAAQALFDALRSGRPAPAAPAVVVAAGDSGAPAPQPLAVPPAGLRAIEPDIRRTPPGVARTRRPRSGMFRLAAGVVVLALLGGGLYAAARGGMGTLRAQAIAILFPTSRPPAAAVPVRTDDDRGATSDVRAALADTTARLDRIEHETGARLDKLAERVDQGVATTAPPSDVPARLEALEKAAAAPAAAAPGAAASPGTDLSALSARLDRLEKKLASPAAPAPDLAARLDKIEKKLAAVTAAKPVAAAAAKPAPGPGSQPTAANEPGASQRVLPDFAVEGVQGGVAMVASRFGGQQVAPGDVIPGAGRVLRIERRGGQWVVVTSGGVIAGGPGPF